jgi:hypothetical protein
MFSLFCRVIIPCLVFQYIHAIFTGMAYYMHEPLPEDNTTLHDLGFEALPYLSNDAVSEILVYLGAPQRGQPCPSVQAGAAAGML